MHGQKRINVRVAQEALTSAGGTARKWRPPLQFSPVQYVWRCESLARLSLGRQNGGNGGKKVNELMINEWLLNLINRSSLAARETTTTRMTTTPPEPCVVTAASSRIGSVSRNVSQPASQLVS